jgi:predicted dehydrogenase
MTQKVRTVGSGPRQGQPIPVEVLTHFEALLTLESGVPVSLATSFEAPGGTASAPLEVYGTRGTLQVPDPNTFGGPVLYRRRGDQPWQEVPLLFSPSDNARGLGLAEMALALPQTDAHRASGGLALHVLEVMEGIQTSAGGGGEYRTAHLCPRPRALT